MVNLATASSAKLEIRHEGESYWLSPFRLADMGEIEEYLTARPFELAAKQMDALGDRLSEAAEERILAHAQQIADESTVGSPLFVTHLSTVAGVSAMVFMSLRRNHPDITKEQATAMVTVETLGLWRERMDRVTGMSDPDDDADPTQEPETESPTSPSTGDSSIE